MLVDYYQPEGDSVGINGDIWAVRSKPVVLQSEDQRIDGNIDFYDKLRSELSFLSGLQNCSSLKWAPLRIFHGLFVDCKKFYMCRAMGHFSWIFLTNWTYISRCLSRSSFVTLCLVLISHTSLCLRSEFAIISMCHSPYIKCIQNVSLCKYYARRSVYVNINIEN